MWSGLRVSLPELVTIGARFTLVRQVPSQFRFPSGAVQICDDTYKSSCKRLVWTSSCLFTSHGMYFLRSIWLLNVSEYLKRGVAGTGSTFEQLILEASKQIRTSVNARQDWSATDQSSRKRNLRQASEGAIVVQRDQLLG